MTLTEAMRDDFLKPGSNGLLTKMWQPKEILGYYHKSGLPSCPKFAPGAGFHDADTNYVLLGLTIESLTGRSLAENFRSRILEKCGMVDTYFLYREEACGSGLAHHFAFNGQQNLDIIQIGMNTSLDWAGGGLVSTVDDLARFIRALFHGKFFQRRETLAVMTAVQQVVDKLENGGTESGSTALDWSVGKRNAAISTGGTKGTGV